MTKHLNNISVMQSISFLSEVKNQVLPDFDLEFTKGCVY